MRLTHFVAAAALAWALPAAAMAQTPPQAAQGPLTQPATTQPPASSVAIRPNQWIASGFVGSNFNSTIDNTDLKEGANLAFGGQVSYLIGGTVGAELLAEFAPTFSVPTVAFADDPHVNTYMANVIAAVPIGADGAVQPYFSGGLGGIQMGGDVLNVLTDPNAGTTAGNEMRFGANVGGGLMAFAGRVGFRADVRYFRTSSDDNPNALTTIGPADQLTQNLLTGLTFWRANAGVAFRW